MCVFNLAVLNYLFEQSHEEEQHNAHWNSSMEKEISSTGCFPADLMAHIANYSSVPTVTAMLLTSKYWDKILSPLLAHPAVTIITRSEQNISRTLYHFQRGRGYYLRSKDVEDDVYPREYKQDSDAHIGYFNSLIEMRAFLNQLRSILTDPNPSAPIGKTNRFSEYYAMIGSSIEDLHCYDLTVPIQEDQDEIKRVKRCENLRQYLMKSSFVSQDHYYGDTDHINIHIMHQTKKYSQDLDLTVLADGDVICRIDGEVFREYRVRTSENLFANLVEIIKYSKHRRSVDKVRDTSSKWTVYAFNLRYEPLEENPVEDSDSDNTIGKAEQKAAKGYYIQHQVILDSETNRHSVVTNEYKTMALERVVKLLEKTLFNPKLAGPTLIREKLVALPPQSKGNALFNSVRFDPKLRSVGLPNIVAIVMNIKDVVGEYNLALYTQKSLEDLKETIKFFIEIEDALQETDKRDFKINCILRKKYRITGASVKIYTHSPEPIIVEVHTK